MFVLQSTHLKVIQQRNHEQKQAMFWHQEYGKLNVKWNSVVEKINEKGGMDFLNNGSISAETVNQFTDDELRSLLQLVHPDKHGGKQSAVLLTQKINQLRGK